MNDEWFETLNVPYQQVYNKMTFPKDLLDQQRKDYFTRDITFSIVVPLYNTPENFLREMIESVQAQTYEKWELCLADGSEPEHSFVEEICREYTDKDSRILYKKLDKNYGISGNTNEGLKMGSGELIGLLDHDDVLHPAALHEVMKAICDGNADFIYTDEAKFIENPEKDAFCPHFKPDFAPDNMLAYNYICHFTVFSRKILDTVGDFRSEYDGSQDHDFVLRATDAAACIAHIPEVLYFWRNHPNSAAAGSEAKPYAAIAGRKAVKAHIIRLGRKGKVSSSDDCPTIYRIQYKLTSHPKISILIPNYEHLDDLQKCIQSILKKTTYDNFDILIIENNSSSKEIFDYYETIQREHDNVCVVQYAGIFNFSSICNFGVKHCSGEILLFLNNDTEVISEAWLVEMMMYAQRGDVGAVGAKLYYPNETIQHAGVLLGVGGIAGHYSYGEPRNHPGYMGRLIFAQNQTAVTGACLMVRRAVFNQVGGFEEKFAVAFNDIDFCMKLRRNGYLNIWTPFAELYHYESKSRGPDTEGEKAIRFSNECRLFRERWSEELDYGDPYYNPNFTLPNGRFQCKSVILPHAARYTRKNNRPGSAEPANEQL